MKRISRRKAIKALYNSAGKIFYAEFIKKDGSLRRMTARLGVHKGINGKGMRYNPAAYGLLPVFDMNRTAWRMINLNALKQLHLNHEKLTVL